MGVNSELKQWLERPELNTISSLESAMKVWNSAEFTYTSKYEVIVQHFIQLVSRTRTKEVATEDFLKIVKEFVNLQYPIGSLSMAAKSNMLSAVVEMRDIGSEDVRLHLDILRSLQVHNRMANFYNSNQILYGKMVSKMFSHHLVLLDKADSVTAEHGEEIKQQFKDIKTFIHYNLSTSDFEAVFVKHFSTALTNMVIKCQSMEYSLDSEYFALLQLLFLNPEQAQTLKDYFKGDPTVEKNYFTMFPNDQVLLVFLDALMATYHNDKEMINLFIDFVFERFPSDENNKCQIMIFRHVLFLLRKYNINIPHFKPVNMISTLIMEIVAKKSQTHPVEVLDLICQAIQWNPMIIQDDVLIVIVHFMMMDKDQKTLDKYAELLRRVMSGYTRLNRFEKKTGKLLEMVKVEMDKLTVAQKLKRKLNNSAEPASSKKKKLNNSSAVIVESKDEGTRNYFLSLLEQSYLDKPTAEPTWDQNWSDMQNIWPKSVAQLWSQSVSNLVTKTSLMIWKSLLINLKESLSIANTRSYDDKSILYIKFVCCFLVEYLAGTRVLEHSDQLFGTVEEMCDQTKEILKVFGRQILETEHNTELVNTFLSVVEKYGSFETSLLYYHPDSIVDSNAADENAALKRIDLKQKTRSVYEFLTDDEWSLIEQRVINFGKENCRSKFTELNFRKVKSIQLCDPEFVCHETKTWNKTIVGDYGLLARLSENRLYFEEFISELTRKQKITLAKTMFESPADQDEQKRKFVELIAEEYEMLELSVIVLLNSIADTHLHEGSLLKRIDFNAIMQNQEITLPDIKEAMNNEDENVTEIKEKKGLLTKLNLIHSMPLGYFKEREKETVYTLHVLLSHDLSGHPELKSRLLDNIRLIRELGFRFNGLKYLDLSSQLKMLPTGTGHSMLLDIVANYFGDTQLKQVKGLLKRIAKDEDQNVDLTLLMAHRFSLAKKNHKNEKTMQIYRMKINKLVFNVYERNYKSQKASGLLYALNMYLDDKENLATVNGDLGKLCLKVARRRLFEDGEEVEEHKFKILSYCFQHIKHFELDVKDLEAVLDTFWNKLKTIKDIEGMTAKSKVDLISLFGLYGSTERYMEIMTEIEQMAEEEEDLEGLRLICKHLQNFSERPVSQSKGLVLSEFLKKILNIIILKFTLRSENVYDQPELILDILKCFSMVAQNRQIVMSDSLFANILSFSLDINLKRCKVTENNCTTFTRIHEQMSQMCTSLINARSLSLKNAMPQFVSVLKDLIHTICAFRNGRSDSRQKLADEEVEMVANLAHRLEPILNGFSDKEQLGRKVAPYLLVYVINEMIFNPNSTTLYPAVKLAINNVCYKLIAICDVKYSQFILRGCSEASRDVYKTLVKEYEQYYKFQGKV